MTELKAGDRVRWLGPSDGNLTEGELGWLLEVEEGLGENVVTWDKVGTEVVEDLTMLEKVGDRNEPDPYKRAPGDPLNPESGSDN